MFCERLGNDNGVEPLLPKKKSVHCNSARWLLLVCGLFSFLGAIQFLQKSAHIEAGVSTKLSGTDIEEIKKFIFEEIWKKELKLGEGEFLHPKDFFGMEMFEGEDIKEFDTDGDGKITLEELQNQAVTEIPNAESVAAGWEAAAKKYIDESWTKAALDSLEKDSKDDSGASTQDQAGATKAKAKKRRNLNNEGNFVAPPRPGLSAGNAALCDNYKYNKDWACNRDWMGSANLAGKVKRNKLANLQFSIFNRLPNQVAHTPTWRNQHNVCHGDMFYGMGSAVVQGDGVHAPAYEGWMRRYRGSYPRGYNAGNSGWYALRNYFNDNYPLDLDPLLNTNEARGNQGTGPKQLLNYLWHYPSILAHCQAQQAPNNKRPMIHFIINKEIFFFGHITYHEISTVMALWPHLDAARKEGIVFWLFDQEGARARIYSKLPRLGWQPDPDVRQAIDAAVQQWNAAAVTRVAPENPDTYIVSRSV